MVRQGKAQADRHGKRYTEGRSRQQIDKRIMGKCRRTHVGSWGSSGYIQGTWQCPLVSTKARSFSYFSFHCRSRTGSHSNPMPSRRSSLSGGICMGEPWQQVSAQRDTGRGVLPGTNLTGSRLGQRGYAKGFATVGMAASCLTLPLRILSRW